MRTLTGKTALVTGGTSGIGSEIVAALRARDINIVTCGRREGAGDHGEHDRNGVVYVKADVGSERDVTHLVEAALERFGGIDFLVNNAGTEGDVAPPGDYPVETFDRVIRTNLRGPFLMLRHALPHLLESGGVVVNIASFVGTVVPVPIASAYGASKAGVLSLTASTAAAYGESGLRIFSVAPWITDTPMMDRVSGGDEGALEQLVALNPSGTIARAEDVAGSSCRCWRSRRRIPAARPSSWTPAAPPTPSPFRSRCRPRTPALANPLRGRRHTDGREHPGAVIRGPSYRVLDGCGSRPVSRASALAARWRLAAMAGSGAWRISRKCS